MPRAGTPPAAQTVRTGTELLTDTSDGSIAAVAELVADQLGADSGGAPVAAAPAEPARTVDNIGTLGGSLADVAEKLTILYYGDVGTTKTTSALMLSERGRTVLINAEAGAKPTPLKARGVNLDNVVPWPGKDKDGNQLGPDYITYDRIIAEVFEPMRADLIRDPNSWYGVCVDSFSELSKRLITTVADAAARKAALTNKPREQFQVDLADHGVGSQMMRQLLRGFRDLGIHVAITALERRDVDQQSGKVKYGPAVGPAIANDTMGLVDVVLWCKREEIGDREFVMGICRPLELRSAKDRFDVLPVRMIDPTTTRILDYMSGALTRETDPLQIEVRAAVDAIAGTPAPAVS